MNERARRVWAATRLHVWPERYRLIGLPPERLGDAAGLVARASGGFAGLVLERDEVSLALPEGLWKDSPYDPTPRETRGPTARSRWTSTWTST